ncbi:MAG: ATP-binding region ATPase domain protein [Gemmatimonadetes bacterium]|nr:ATP-binding region ATPase domain protein [Gemmatimonadota bacterium]
MTRLPDFSRSNTEPILAEWETFARSLPLGDSMDIAALRDHAKEMLGVMATDLSAVPTPQEQASKAQGQLDAGALESEAVDQAIAESITTYTRELRRSKDRFLAILGHDLRTPIGALVMSTRFILDTGDGLSDPHRMLVTRMEATARRMNRLVADLLEFTRTRFGEGIPVVVSAMDAGRMLEDVAAEVRSSYPTSAVSVRSTGDLRGAWDCERLSQAITNLVSNAAHHGTEGAPIEIAADGSTDALVISVRNQGPAIAPEQLDRIFDETTALDAPRAGSDRRHLGLGLYIVATIVHAHRGSITARSSAVEGTVFSVRLPRDTASSPDAQRRAQ